MTRSFIAAPAVDVASQAKSAVFISNSQADYWQQPRFLNWMLNGVSMRRYPGGEYFTASDLIGSVRGLPPYPMLNSETQYTIYIRIGADPGGGTDAALTIDFSGCTIVATGLASQNTSTPGRVTGNYSYAYNSATFSLRVTPTAPGHSITVVPTALLGDYAGGKIFLDAPAEDYDFAAGVRFMHYTNVMSLTEHVDRSDWALFIAPEETETAWPPSVMAKYCATYDLHAHICVPVQYDETSVRAFIQDFLTEFPTDKIAVVEYSNEIWNSDYQAYAAANILADWPTANSGSTYDKATWLMKRSCEVMTIVREEFASAGRSHQLRTGLSIQTASTTAIDHALTGDLWITYDKPGVIEMLGLDGGATDPEIATALDAYISGLHDLILCTGYFGDMPNVGITHGQEIVDQLATDADAAKALFLGYAEDDLPNLATYFENIRSRAVARGMGFMQYEGQQHLDMGQLRYGSRNSPFWNCTVDVSDGNAFTVGETADHGAYSFKIIAKTSTTLVLGTGISLDTDVNIVGQSSAASQKPSNRRNDVLADGVSDMYKAALWSSEMGALQDTARTSFLDAGGTFINQFQDFNRYSDTGNWGTMQWAGDTNPVHTALSDWAAANPRRKAF